MNLRFDTSLVQGYKSASQIARVLTEDWLARNMYCPICGEVTEVYSRITGYYRPIQNWNVGKSKEFKDRKTYEVDFENLDEIKCDCSKQEEQEQTNKVDHLMLFTTKTCPNCKMAKMILDKEAVKYEIIDAEENIDLVKSFGITKAPTLLVPTSDGYEVYDNASKIKGYVESVK